MLTDDSLTFYKDVRFWVVLVSLMSLMIISCTTHY